MSVPSTTGRNEFNFNGSLTSFTFDFPIIETSDLLVIVCLIATGVETPLTEGTDYEVTSALGDFSSGGTVSMIEYIDDVKTPKAWPATYKLILLRNVPAAQGVDFTENMATLYQNFEDGLDRLTMLIQQIQEIQDRTLTVPQSEASTLSRELPTAVARKNMLLGFDENGEPCAAYPGEQGPTGADGADGSDGADAAEITSVAWDGNDMKFTKDDATTFSLEGAKVDLKGDTGSLVQKVTGSTNSLITGNTPMYFDDTIPQKTEGFDVVSVAITPSNASNILAIRAVANVSNNASSDSLVMGLFQDDIANALVAAGITTKSNEPRQMVLEHSMVAGSTSEITFKIRVGPSSSAYTVTVNGNNSSRLLGGSSYTVITIEEITT